MSPRRAKPPGAGLAKPRGASPKTALIRMRVDPDLKDRVEVEARNCRMTVSAWLTWLVERELDAR